MTVGRGMHDWVKTRGKSIPSLPKPRPRFPESDSVRQISSRQASKVLNFGMIYGGGDSMQTKSSAPTHKVRYVTADLDFSDLEMRTLASLMTAPAWECSRCGSRCGSENVPPASKYRSIPVRCKHSVMFIEEDMGVADCDIAMASQVLLS